jgi:hypothetical protein
MDFPSKAEHLANIVRDPQRNKLSVEGARISHQVRLTVDQAAFVRVLGARMGASLNKACGELIELGIEALLSKLDAKDADDIMRTVAEHATTLAPQGEPQRSED